VVNVVGSFALGFLLPYTLDQAGISPSFRAMLTIGFCGGFTTFSTFSYEALALMQDGQWSRAAGYMAGSVAFSLAAVFAGWILAHQLLIHGRQA
jgi:CrcB protein